MRADDWCDRRRTICDTYTNKNEAREIGQKFIQIHKWIKPSKTVTMCSINSDRVDNANRQTVEWGPPVSVSGLLLRFHAVANYFSSFVIIISRGRCCVLDGNEEEVEGIARWPNTTPNTTKCNRSGRFCKREFAMGMQCNQIDQLHDNTYVLRNNMMVWIFTERKTRRQRFFVPLPVWHIERCWWV